MSGQLPGRLPGRRIADRAVRKLGPGVIIAVAAPLVTTVALLAQAPADTQVDTATHAPTRHPLSAVDLICPPSSHGPVTLGSVRPDTEEPEGSLTWRVPGSDARTTVALAAGGTAQLPDGHALLLHGDGAEARGLFGARFSSGRPAAAECASPAGVRWFVGAGSGAAHLSTLTLANPDGGPAVADVTIWSVDGKLEQIESRGLTIPGGHVSTLPLERLAPNADELAVRVVVARGRLSSMLRDEYGDVGGPVRTDGLPASATPARTQLVPALTRKASSRVLTLVNPSSHEARVKLQLVGARSTFTPTGLEEIRVPAGRVVVTDLTKALSSVIAEEDVALRLESTSPVTAGLREIVAGDLLHHPAVALGNGSTASVLPAAGTRSVVVSAGATAGQVTLTWPGSSAAATVVRLAPGTSQAFEVPKGATTVVVSSKVDYVAAVRVQSGDGATVIPLRPLLSDLLVPSVRPAWPPR
ncbi:DUF5719 family protein [Nocardioides cavernaquae]|uniref:Secreted protein n=1 Tax=Nocardioides cavernaquae TaxID=2321396 RepID=A0A3A5HFW7_9ACTN|nr:DUF5719 family protein [Nocardioides cavernaquae]RJS46627.1 hypothetical protein D4739_10635 [Nocardioides cavernaquae]